MSAPGGRWLRLLPTRRFAGLLAATAPVWLLSGSSAGAAVAFGVSGLALLAGVVEALLLPPAAALRVRRTLPASIGLGDEADARYALESRWHRPLQVEVYDALTAGLMRMVAPDAPPWRIGGGSVPPGGSAELAVGVTGSRRGNYRLPPVVVRVRSPLGLVQRTIVSDDDAAIDVVPSIAGVRRYRLLALQHRLREAGIRTIRRRGQGTSFANLRDYVRGDDPRRMDWKASARRGKLITREFTVEQGQTVLIAIDAGRMMTQLADGVSRFEHALASATVLADVAARSGDQIGLIVFDDEIRAFVPPARGALALRRIRDALLPLLPTMAEPDYAGAFRTLAARHRKRSLLVLYTDVVDPRASRALIAHTARSTARHLPLVVALRNDALVRAALPRAGGTEALFGAAAAEELLLERAEALAAMRAAGAHVLDVSTRQLTAAVINGYLAIKARASL